MNNAMIMKLINYKFDLEYTHFKLYNVLDIIIYFINYI